MGIAIGSLRGELAIVVRLIVIKYHMTKTMHVWPMVIKVHAENLNGLLIKHCHF